MATKYSPSTTFNEFQEAIAEPPITTGWNCGGLLPANSGEGNTVITLNDTNDLLEVSGKPNEYNYLLWWQIYDYLLGAHQFKLVRPLPSNAKNSSEKFRGTSLLSSGTWYDSILSKTLEKPTDKFYNRDVAEYALEQTFTTDYKIQIINRNVTSDQDLVVSICSNTDHYEEPIFNEEMSVIRNFDQDTAPASPVKFEAYTIKRATVNVKTANDTTDIITVEGDYTALKTGDIIIISGSTANDGTYDLTADVTFDGTDSTLTLDSGDLTDSTADGAVSYLLGDWSTESTFVDGVLVDYDGSTWALVTLTLNDKYYVELYGAVYKFNDMTFATDYTSQWVKQIDSYLPVDADGNGKAEYAVQNIFNAGLYNIDNSLKTFKQIYKENLDFDNNTALIFVLKKNITTEKWDLVEQHYGSYLATDKDDQNRPFGIEYKVLNDSNYIYAKVGYSTWDVTSINVVAPGSDTIVLANDLRHIQVGETITLNNVLFGGNNVIKTFTVNDVAYSSPNITFTVDEDTTGYTVDTDPVTKLSDIVCGKVSTNMNKYADPRNASYDLTNDNAATGYGVIDLLIYDTAPVNGSGASITDYSDLESSDLETGAETFLDKDNVKVNILLPFETIDEFNNHHQNKMSEIAETIKQCYVPVCPYDYSLFAGNDGDTIKDNLIAEFGNQRSNLYQGTFIKFGKYSGTEGNMKQIVDIYNNNKVRWVSVAGDIARMIIDQDYDPTKGVFVPIAGEGNGEMVNQVKLAWIPDEDQREELNKNAINTVYKNASMTYPMRFSNFTSYLIRDLFQVMSYRLLLNKIEDYISDNLFPLYFKFKSDTLKKRISDLINPFLQDFVTVEGGLESATFTFQYVKNEPSDTLTMNVDVIPTGVLIHFIVNITMTEQGIELTETTA